MTLVDIQKYRDYLAWLKSLPRAKAIGTWATCNDKSTEPTFTIEGQSSRFTLEEWWANDYVSIANLNGEPKAFRLLV